MCNGVWKCVSNVFDQRYTHTRTHTLQRHTTRGIMTKDDEDDLAHEFFEVRIFSSLYLSRLEYDADGKLIKITCLNAVGEAEIADNSSISGKKKLNWDATLLIFCCVFC